MNGERILDKKKSATTTLGVVITMQHTADVNERRALMVAMLADGVQSATVNALTSANNVRLYHEQSVCSNGSPKISQAGSGKAWTNFMQEGEESEPHSGRDKQPHGGKESPTVLD